ncbi:MAG TPA: DNA recombination protein RmuC [Myxococcota bacterium]|nr:DNA recombination protein RmuC [Myxococcota bacterium]
METLWTEFWTQIGAGWNPAIFIALAVAGVAACAALAWGAARRRHALRDAFQAVAAEALRQNNEGFLALAAERFRALQDASTADWSGRRQSIEEVVTPLRDALAHYQREAQELERLRALHGGQMSEQLRALASQTSELAHALRAPGSRGRWGELTLRRTVELAGLSAHCDFAEQVSLGAGAGAARPDLLVRLPGGREIAVDAKAPLDAYLEAVEAKGPAEREQALARHAGHVKRHVEALAARGYAERLERSPEFVVLFLPHEGFLGAAVEHDSALVAEALARGVVVATPATLYALLAAVAHGWREQRLADGAHQVLTVAREMEHRLVGMTGHLSRLGNALERSVAHFNTAVGSFESRVLPQARRLRELGAGGQDELTPPVRIDVVPRPVSTSDNASDAAG